MHVNATPQTPRQAGENVPGPTSFPHLKMTTLLVSPRSKNLTNGVRLRRVGHVWSAVVPVAGFNFFVVDNEAVWRIRQLQKDETWHCHT